MLGRINNLSFLKANICVFGVGDEVILFMHSLLSAGTKIIVS